jgi:hypothetical protein
MLEKIPHWIVGEQRYTSQFETWQAITKTNLPARFCLYEDAFDQIDWTQDPSESWNELLRVRCIQLRQKYKNLKLLYSGGRDTHHILLTFIKFQIPIDELVIVNYSRNPVRAAEYVNWIKPMALRYLQHNPQAKITTINLGVDDYRAWYHETWSEKITATTMSGYFQPGDYGWMLEQKGHVVDSSTGVMCGLEKPELVVKDDKLYAYNTDGQFMHYLHNIGLMEFFYITPDLPELHAKQAWLIVNHLLQHYPNADSNFIANFQQVHSGHYDELAIAVGRGPAVNVHAPEQNGLAKYSGAHPTFQVLKKIMLDEAPEVWNRYKENMDWFYKNFDDPVRVTSKSWWRGAQFLSSKLYYVCDWPVNKAN